MSHRLRYDEQWVKNAAGLYVKSEPISAALVAAASTGQVVAKQSDGTLGLTTVSGGGGGGVTVLYDSGPLASAQAALDTGASELSQDYDVLEVWFMGRTDEATAFSNASLTFNNDTGNNYDRQHGGFRGSGTNQSHAAAQSNVQNFCCGASYDAGAFGITRATIPFYAETTAHKMVELSQATIDSNSSRSAAEVYIARWRNSAAITRLAFTAPSGKNLVAGSHLIVYGR